MAELKVDTVQPGSVLPGGQITPGADWNADGVKIVVLSWMARSDALKVNEARLLIGPVSEPKPKTVW